MIKEKVELMMLTYDFMFKAVFGSENNIEPLTKLISDYFNIDINKIKGKVRIMNSELIKNNKTDKKKCVDIIVEINENEILNIEMNTNKSKEEFATIERNTAYICKIFSEQYKSGDKYNKTKKCIQLNFNNFGISGEKDGKAVFMLRDEEGENELTENLEIHYINMEYINSMCYNEFTDSEIIKWVKLIKSKTMEELKMRSEFMDDDMREKFIGEVEKLSSDEHIIGLYNAELEDEIMRNTIRDYNKELGYKEGHEQGLEQGLEQGIEQGLEQGIEQGIELGIEQGTLQNQKQVVINMLKDDLDIKLISKYTNVDIETIQQIKENIEG